ncbi:hypothetical protein B0H15DRAFT_832537 [Mycena belliarum]|uniref:Uncharacterized protein n=1 Tax=Mycena belliarum TaxID=1033014 RepID=A0AAD6U872_9AGAR|nr:hypothetical protein B0H15DRAFT_832537 [Mycena belliae]
MTRPSAAQKRKKKREQQLREEKEKLQAQPQQAHVPVSTPVCPPPASAPPVTATPAVSVFPVDDTPPALARPSTFGRPIYPPHIHAFLYGSPPEDEDDDPIEDAPPRFDLRPPARSWYDDPPAVDRIQSIYATPTPPPPRDFSALRSETAHPWRTVRRRNQRLLPLRRPFPQSYPKRPPVLSQLPPLMPSVRRIGDGEPTPLLAAADPEEDPGPIPLLVLPRPQPLPYDPYHFMPRETPTPDRSLPAETFYGLVQSGLALVCAYEYPWNDIARRDISEIAWGVPPPYESDRRESVLDLLPADHLVFLMVLTRISDLAPVFAGFLEPAIADFVNAWLHHCWFG